MEKGNFIRITPFIHVPDIDDGDRLLRDARLHDLYFHAGTYAYLQREGAGVRLLQNQRRRWRAAGQPALRVLHRCRTTSKRSTAN